LSFFGKRDNGQHSKENGSYKRPENQNCRRTLSAEGIGISGECLDDKAVQTIIRYQSKNENKAKSQRGIKILPEVLNSFIKIWL